jgi:hypothetical protein
MTPEYFRSEARKLREIAAALDGSPCSQVILARAATHDLVADILIELRKINTALSTIDVPCQRAQGTLH